MSCVSGRDLLHLVVAGGGGWGAAGSTPGTKLQANSWPVLPGPDRWVRRTSLGFLALLWDRR